MTVADEQSEVEAVEGLESRSRRSALKLGLTGAGVVAGGAALASILAAGPAGATGNGSVTVLQLNWNGTTVTLTAVLPEGYDPAVGGVVSGVMKYDTNDLTCPIVLIDGTSNVVRMVALISQMGAGYNSVWMVAVDSTSNRIPWGFIGMTQEVATGNPGEVNPDGVPANTGMITPDADGSIWVCTETAPTPSWHHHLVPYGDTGGGAPSSSGTYVGQLATDGGSGVLYMWSGGSWLSTTLT